MNKELVDKLSAKYKNFKQTRTKEEIEITTQLARSLTEININRLQMPINKTPSSRKNINREDILYVYCYGTPPYEDELKYVNLPGQTVFVIYTPALKGQTEQETRKQPYTFSDWAKIMNERINEASLTKPIILVYHSFGTYIVSAYLNLFPNNRVIGMVDIGGIPLRFHRQLQNICAMLELIDFTQIDQTIDDIYQGYKDMWDAKNKEGDRTINPHVLSNKYQLLALLKCLTDQKGIDWVFSRHKQWPKILKCFIFGRNDFLFRQKLLSQKAIYYSYFQKWDENYQKLTSDAYYKLKGIKESNVQSRFVFSIQRGSHSLHMQKKNKEVFAKVIDEYLSTIQEIYSLKEPKL